MSGRPSLTRIGSTYLEDLPGLGGDQAGQRRRGVVLGETVGGHEFGDEARVHAARHVVPGRDRAERPGVVDEAGEAAETRDLGDGLLVAADLGRGVEGTPPRPPATPGGENAHG